MFYSTGPWSDLKWRKTINELFLDFTRFTCTFPELKRPKKKLNYLIFDLILILTISDSSLKCSKISYSVI
jgi:hypothetical protein